MHYLNALSIIIKNIVIVIVIFIDIQINKLILIFQNFRYYN